MIVIVIVIFCLCHLTISNRVLIASTDVNGGWGPVKTLFQVVEFNAKSQAASVLFAWNSTSDVIFGGGATSLHGLQSYPLYVNPETLDVMTIASRTAVGPVLIRCQLNSTCAKRLYVEPINLSIEPLAYSFPSSLGSSSGTFFWSPSGKSSNSNVTKMVVGFGGSELGVPEVVVGRNQLTLNPGPDTSWRVSAAVQNKKWTVLMEQVQGDGRSTNIHLLRQFPQELSAQWQTSYYEDGWSANYCWFAGDDLDTILTLSIFDDKPNESGIYSYQLDGAFGRSLLAPFPWKSIPLATYDPVSGYLFVSPSVDGVVPIEIWPLKSPRKFPIAQAGAIPINFLPPNHTMVSWSYLTF